MGNSILDDLSFEELERAYLKANNDFKSTHSKNNTQKEINIHEKKSIVNHKCLFGGKDANKICDEKCHYYITCTRRIK